MKKLLLFLGALATLTAQTAIRPDQIRLVPSPLTTPALAVKLAAWDVFGTLTYLDIGPGVKIVNGTITADVQAPIVPAVPVLLTTRLTRATDGTYQASNGIIARNGIIQRAGDDYTVVGGVMTPKTAWTDDDIILAITSALMVQKP